MNKLLDIYTAPRKVFTDLKENPKWIIPFIIVLMVVAITAALTIGMTKQSIMANQREILEEKGLTEEKIEQTLAFTRGPLPIVIGAAGGTIGTAIILLLFTFLVNLLIPLFGGISLYKKVFSVVCFSSLIKIPSIILKLILIAITKSPYVTTSLALLVPNFAKKSFTYQLLTGFDFFIIWEMIVVAIGISITNEVKQKNAYILVFLIWIISIFIGIGLGSFGWT